MIFIIIIMLIFFLVDIPLLLDMFAQLVVSCLFLAVFGSVYLHYLSTRIESYHSLS